MKNFYRKKGLKLVVEIKQRDGFIRKIHLRESYIVGVLGVQRKVLFESLVDSSLQKIIIKEHLLFEGWWDDAQNIVKNSINTIKNEIHSGVDILKKYGENVKGVAAALYLSTKDESAMNKIKEVSASFMDRNNFGIRKSLKSLKKKFEEWGFGSKTEYIDNLIEKFNSVYEKISSITGWKGMIISLTGFLGFSFLNNKLLNFVSKMNKKENALELFKNAFNFISEFFKNNIEGFISKIDGLNISEYLKILENIFQGSKWVLEKIISIIKTCQYELKDLNNPGRISLDK